MAFVFAIPEAVLRGLYLNFRFLFKEGNPLFSESQTHLLERSYLFAFYHKIAIEIICNSRFNKLFICFIFQAKINAIALKLEQQIILADCQVLAAILNFINQVRHYWKFAFPKSILQMFGCLTILKGMFDFQVCWRKIMPPRFINIRERIFHFGKSFFSE